MPRPIAQPWPPLDMAAGAGPSSVLPIPDILSVIAGWLLEFQMKSVLYRLAALSVKLLTAFAAVLSACIGCSSKNPPDAEQPHVIHWHGPSTGYEDTTTEADDSRLK